MNIKKYLRLERPGSSAMGDCDNCASRAMNHFCTMCNGRFCAEHVDSPKHGCGLAGLTKKQLRAVMKARKWGPSEREQKAIEFGKEMAKKRAEDEAKGQKRLADKLKEIIRP